VAADILGQHVAFVIVVGMYTMRKWSGCVADIHGRRSFRLRREEIQSRALKQGQ
jgi:hypothetical protein